MYHKMQQNTENVLFVSENNENFCSNKIVFLSLTIDWLDFCLFKQDSILNFFLRFDGFFQLFVCPPSFLGN